MENCVPIIEITDENITSMWPAISSAISQSSFIALDCELSGLGNRSKLNSPEIDVRYTNTKEIAQEYSIVSFGISCFKCQLCSPLTTKPCNDEKLVVKSHSYIVQTFNILTLCSTKYTVDTRSAKFLLSHGFDFNNQYAHGLPYERGEDPQMDKQNTPTVKQIFRQIIKHRKPIVLHNGFVDLVFMYQCFYAELPKNIDTFASDLLEMFPAGIYDTKYISEYHQSFPATYLEFVFKSLQMENCKRDQNGQWHCRFKFLPYPKQIHGLEWHYYLQVFEKDPEESSDIQQPLCESYKYHGWCSQADTCKRSHNINRIVKELQETSKGKRKNVTNGIATFSLAQLINMKKQKMEEAKSKSAIQRVQDLSEDKNPSKSTCYNNSPVNTVISGTNFKDATHSNDGEDTKFQYIGNGSGGNETNSKNSISAEVDVTNTISSNPCKHLEPDLIHRNGSESNSHVCDVSSPEKFGDLERLETHSIGDGNATRETTPSTGKDVNSSDFKSINDFESLTLINKSNGCSGHSAGMDAFMTGFIFACDVAILGILPQVSSFTDPKQLNLHHMVSKVYLIGKEFPFLVRSSSYNGTSPGHDKIIKLLRNN